MYKTKKQLLVYIKYKRLHKQDASQGFTNYVEMKIKTIQFFFFIFILLFISLRNEIDFNILYIYISGGSCALKVGGRYKIAYL